jgi:hypothetical protein
MTSTNNIAAKFGTKTTVGGLPLMAYKCLLPAERVWLQEKGSVAADEFRKARLALVDKIQQKFKFKERYDAYKELSSYEQGYINAATSEVASFVEVEGLENPSSPADDSDVQRLTYLIASRLVVEDVTADSMAAMGVEWTGQWTKEHTIAIGAATAEISEFFATESNGGVPVERSAPKSLGENSPN